MSITIQDLMVFNQTDKQAEEFFEQFYRVNKSHKMEMYNEGIATITKAERMATKLARNSSGSAAITYNLKLAFYGIMMGELLFCNEMYSEAIPHYEKALGLYQCYEEYLDKNGWEWMEYCAWWLGLCYYNAHRPYQMVRETLDLSMEISWKHRLLARYSVALLFDPYIDDVEAYKNAALIGGMYGIMGDISCDYDEFTDAKRYYLKGIEMYERYMDMERPDWEANEKLHEKAELMRFREENWNAADDFCSKTMEKVVPNFYLKHFRYVMNSGEDMWKYGWIDS